MLAEPLLLDAAAMVPPMINPMQGDMAVTRMVKKTRQANVVVEALKDTDLRFSLVKS